MSEERAEQIVNDYFGHLRKALLPMPRHRRDQLLDELRAHVEAARAGSPADSEAAVREVLERLGDPEDIAAEALAAATLAERDGRLRSSVERACGRCGSCAGRRAGPRPGAVRVHPDHELLSLRRRARRSSPLEGSPPASPSIRSTRRCMWRTAMPTASRCSVRPPAMQRLPLDALTREASPPAVRTPSESSPIPRPQPCTS